jgi:ABC-type branched-subunit amino acid transport system substrate-binding protein
MIARFLTAVLLCLSGPRVLLGSETAEPFALCEATGSAETADARPYGATPGNLIPYARWEDPYRQFFLTPPLHRGPGREKPAPDGLTSVAIGLLAPLEGGGNTQVGASMKRGTELALEEANAAGGYGGLPFVLRARNDEALWGSSSNTLVSFAYEDRIWALIGSPDSNSTHVALRAAFKAEIPIVNVGSTDPTLTETGLPWIIRLTPDDRQTSYRLAQLLFVEHRFARVAVVRASNRYGRFGVREFRDAARRLQRPLPLEIQFAPGQQNFTSELDRVERARVDAVLLWADAQDAARIVRAVRGRGMIQPIFGTDRMVSPEFLDLAGAAAENVVATTWMSPGRDDPAWLAFRSRFRERFGIEPDVHAAYTYDAARLVTMAIRHSGLNRVRIRDAFACVLTFQGVSGDIVLDATHNSISPPHLVQVKGGEYVLR